MKDEITREAEILPHEHDIARSPEIGRNHKIGQDHEIAQHDIGKYEIAQPEISRKRLRSAWVVALGADFLQIVAFPFFLEGLLSPADDALDVIVAGALTALIGWHWSFLPSFLAKLTPGLDLVPTWTAAVFLAARKAAPGAQPPIPIKATSRPGAQEEKLLPSAPPPRPASHDEARPAEKRSEPSAVESPGRTAGSGD